MIHSNTLVWLRNINNSRGKNVYNKSTEYLVQIFIIHNHILNHKEVHYVILWQLIRKTAMLYLRKRNGDDRTQRIVRRQFMR